MNADTLKGQWHQVKGEIRNQWGKLTDSDLDQIQGQSEKLVGKLQERYGYDKERAEQEVREYKSGSTLDTQTDSSATKH